MTQGAKRTASTVLLFSYPVRRLPVHELSRFWKVDAVWESGG